MTAQLAEIESRAMELSLDDRLSLVTLLWDSIAHKESGLSQDREGFAEALCRDREFDDGIEVGCSHEEVMSEVRQVINETRLSQSR